MDAALKDFLVSVMNEPSPSGFEQPAARRIGAYMRAHGAEVTTDVHGNTWGALNPNGRPRVMLAGHCDEIGLMVTYINEQGFLAFRAIGGVNVPLLPGSRVRIHAQGGAVPGVIGVKALHFTKPEEREKAKTKIEELWIDIGAKDRRDAERAVRVGDPATIDAGFLELRNGFVAARAFDDRIGAVVTAEALRLLKGKRFAAAVYGVATVQEEIGLRGAQTSAFGLEPDVGIAVEVGHASDCPDMDKKLVGDVRLGAGPALNRGPNINPVLEELLARAAKKARIKIQWQAEPGATGTDANAMQVSRAGMATALVRIPNRYMHSPVEVVHLKDVEAAARLIAQFVQDLKPEQRFIP